MERYNLVKRYRDSMGVEVSFMLRHPQGSYVDYSSVEALKKSYDNLVQALDEYIEFLDGANHDPVSIACTHGWRCPQKDIDKGNQLRAEIAKLRKAL